MSVSLQTLLVSCKHLVYAYWCMWACLSVWSYSCIHPPQNDLCLYSHTNDEEFIQTCVRIWPASFISNITTLLPVAGEWNNTGFFFNRCSYFEFVESWIFRYKYQNVAQTIQKEQIRIAIDCSSSISWIIYICFWSHVLI